MDDKNIIDKLIDDILRDKESFERKFNIATLCSYNLKKKGFSDIINDDEFMYQIIPNYLKKLNVFIAREQLLLIWHIQYGVRYRVKKSDTVYLKIKQYNEREKETGKLQLKKSLNDFLGIRIILPGIISNKDDILSFLESKKENGKISRCYLREDGNYYGIHCYFAKDNLTFPWELQIWDVKSKESNYREHRVHEEQRKNESEGIF
ncbi:hypothetical protein LMB83_00800 [Limosilactobacillus reuteri]|uniref:hypothetical protein n=1 Tax=Limosilactobacillus reuteri TaxID=1598 RepID=UPI001E2880F2|nr:hypothetical protein [Limosilactobacillus reuteri]MCC4410588.1 hypothetical protein [Limosilactobacillus reuteri]MCC4413754.1 hypothetical protein [Limosilactobacillus reuteri]